MTLIFDKVAPKYWVDLRHARFLGCEPLYGNPRFDLIDCRLPAEVICYAIEDFCSRCHIQPTGITVQLELDVSGADSLLIFTFGAGQPPMVYALICDDNEVDMLLNLISAA